MNIFYKNALLLHKFKEAKLEVTTILDTGSFTSDASLHVYLLTIIVVNRLLFLFAELSSLKSKPMDPISYMNMRAAVDTCFHMRAPTITPYIINSIKC